MELLQKAFPWQEGQDETGQNATWECSAPEWTPRCPVLSVPSALAWSSHLIQQYTLGLLDERHASIMSVIVSNSTQRLFLQRKNDPQFPNTIMVKIQFPDIENLLESGWMYHILEGKKKQPNKKHPQYPPSQKETVKKKPTQKTQWKSSWNNKAIQSWRRKDWR